MSAVKAAIIGPGNIGTDLLMKLKRIPVIEVALVAGIYADSPGLARAVAMGIDTSADGLAAILARADIELVFDATSAAAHRIAAPLLASAGKQVVDLTPAAVGPYVVPTVNLTDHITRDNVNLVSCGGQAAIPFVHAVARVCEVGYAEIVATIASAGAGPGTRQNIDEFTETTAHGVRVVGGAKEAKAIIILNPAQPPILMRVTIFAEVDDPDGEEIRRSVESMAHELKEYVPGVTLVHCEAERSPVTIMVQIEGRGDFLPKYAGNLDIMTAAATKVGSAIAEHMLAGSP